jgi:TPR repeat protein
MNRHFLIISLVLLVCACTKREAPVAQLPDMSAVRAKLAFTCTHESDHLPPLDPKADSLFQYARYLQKKDGPKNFDDMLRYYRIAAAHGHYKANHNAQLLISQGLALSPDGSKEAVDLAAQLVEQGVPGGYFDIGHYLEIGYGLKQDAETSLRYFRKAADLGSPEAQAYVAEQLMPPDKAPAIARQMWECAAAQGYADAAYNLALDLTTDRLFPDAVKSLQKAVEAGDTKSAYLLENGFKGPPESNRLYYLALPNDPERSRRYKLIGAFIDRNDGRSPKVPDIDKIVPLPPAKLPPWDGTFQWQKEQDAAVPPQKPSEELIDELAKAKNLDPATGLPLGGTTSKTSAADQPATVAARLPIGTLATTGEPCPEDGVWCAKLSKGQMRDAQRRFLKGDVLPSLVIHEPRKVALLDQVMGLRQHMAKVEWELVGYTDQA